MTNPEFKYYPELNKGHDLVPLPAGAIVVWGGEDGGHISIADGMGNELSDHQTKQTTNRDGAGFSVFMPF